MFVCVQEHYSLRIMNFSIFLGFIINNVRNLVLSLRRVSTCAQHCGNTIHLCGQKPLSSYTLCTLPKALHYLHIEERNIWPNAGLKKLDQNQGFVHSLEVSNFSSIYPNNKQIPTEFKNKSGSQKPTITSISTDCQYIYCLCNTFMKERNTV